MKNQHAKLLELTPKICALIRDGCTVIDISVRFGITRSTWYYWLERGERETDSVYATFASAVEQARKDYEDSIIQKICTGFENRSKHKAISAKLGITPRTFSNWLARGDEREAGFYFRIAQAIARVEKEASERREKEIMLKIYASPQYQEYLDAVGKSDPEVTVREIPS